MGSKAKYAKFITPIIMKNHKNGEEYIEPFVGGGNLFSEIPIENKWGNDISKYSIALLKAISEGYQPPNIVTEEEYYRVKINQDSELPEYVGFVAFCCSYAGKFWGGYARGCDSKGIDRNFAAEQVRNLRKQQKGLVGAKFTVQDYLTLNIPDNSTVYCDPPYFGTTPYKNSFDHTLFWDWSRKLSKKCTVLVSEYSCPLPDVEILWEKTVSNSLDKNTGTKTGTEKLFLLHS